MSKPLVLGNGNILVCLDKIGQVRDFYFHYIGLENHVGHNCVHRLGVSIEGEFSWLDSIAWEVDSRYADETLATHIRAVNRKWRVEVLISDVVSNERNIFLRQVKITNPDKEERHVKMFFHQQYRIYDTSKRDTGFYDPLRHIVMHYEGRRVFVMGGKCCSGKSFEDYSVGNYGIEGKEGTWKDAEDGRLWKNPIEHGAVDSVIGFDMSIPPESEGNINYWIAVAKTQKEAISLHEYVLEKTPAFIAKTTRDYWTAWVRKGDRDFDGLSADIADFFRTSLLVIKTHVGENGGIIASGDSDMLQYGKDTYAYVWLRDGAYIAMALDAVGYTDATQEFFRFCADVISDEGYFYHKYRCDKSIGSSWHAWSAEGKPHLAIQEDETAIVICALWKHYQASHEVDYIERLYEPLVRKAAEFMLGFRSTETDLPRPSYDIWEQRYAASTYTVSCVCAGLEAAADLAGVLGREDDSTRYREAAARVREAIPRYLLDERTGYFHKSLTEGEGGEIHYDSTVDASNFYGIFYYGILAPGDERLRKAFEFAEKRLTCPSPIGGIMRYENDEYFRVNPGAPGNPWFITTLWFAQYRIAVAQTLDELTKVQDTLRWTMSHSLPSGILSEQIAFDTGEQLSAAPLIWSHAEFLVTVVRYLDKRRELLARG